MKKPHSLLFLGGLGDGVATVDYMADLVTALEPTPWSIFTVNLSSSLDGWGRGSLDLDIEEIAQCVQYVREYKTAKFGSGRVAVMGHSTGSQDVLSYLYRPNPLPRSPGINLGLTYVKRPVIDGAIMQAPVSDREAILNVLEDGTHRDSPASITEHYNKMIDFARKNTFAADGTVDVMLPIEWTTRIYPVTTPISCRRFLSLASPDSPERPSSDDLFSSDLSDDRLRQTFGAIATQGLLRHKLMVLYSGRDRSVPKRVDKHKLLERWQKAANQDGKVEIWDSENSMVIPNASHALSDPDQEKPRRILVAMVTNYLKALENLP